MLKRLILKNLILVEKADICFEPGLTMITGETGAGKTALIEALRLLMGERSDANKVRKGCDKAQIQASFDINPSKALIQLLQEIAIDWDGEEEFLLMREIFSTGKSRAMVAGQMVPISFLQKLSIYLIDFISQHAQVDLKQQPTQHHLLDLYGKIDPTSFQAFWKQEKAQQQALDALHEQKGQSEIRKSLLSHQLDELLAASIQENEEETLFEEYTRLAHSQELLGYYSEILSATTASSSHCAKICQLIEKSSKLDSRLEEANSMAKEAHLAMAELTQVFQSFQTKVEHDPKRLTFLEERLKLFDTLKKKFGRDLFSSQKAIEEELFSFDQLDEKIASAQENLKKIQSETQEACKMLTTLRQQAASELEKFLTKALQELNIPSAEVSIAITPVKRSETGEDLVTFFLRANKGEKPTPIKESSSGGELSRLLFSLKVALAEKSQPSTMVFDEIDANVGGETATIIGRKLKLLGKKRQVLCITHFPQVARHADLHLCISKQEVDARTTSQIKYLDSSAKQQELLRMLGGTTAIR